jgi:Ca2+-binding RTX toxin-like protein
MYGGTGNDVYYVDSANDQVIENAGEGTDTVRTTVDYTLGANVERGVVDTSTGLSLIGNELNNRLNGNAGADHLDGGLGNDVIIGGGGNDTIIGGAGADTVAGGIGNDTFVFNNASDSMPGAYDRITDFQSLNTTGYDHIDFSGIDANVNVDGNQEFAGLQYNYETPTANSLWWSSILNADGTQDVVIYGDTDGNTSTVELELHIHTDHGVNWDQFTL